MTSPTVAVVGGGLAGITAALDCAAAGARVTLLESRGRLGGAAYSFTRDGIHADNGQHVFLRCCTAYRGLLERLGASASVALQSRLEITVLAPEGRRAHLRRSGLPAPLHLAASLARYGHLTPQQRFGVARAMQALRKVDRDDPVNDRRSFGSWLREQRQSEETIHALWELIVRPTLNLTVDGASLAQAAQVFQVGLLEDPAAGDIGHAIVPLSRIHDGAARGALSAAGVDVRLRQGVSEIVPESGAFRIEMGGSPTLVGDAVVLAVSPERALRLLPAQAHFDGSAIARLGSSPIVNLHVVYDRRVLDVPFAAGVRTPVQWVFDRTASTELDGGQYLVISLSAADDELAATADDLRARYLRSMEELLPAARGAGVRTFFVTREHAATFRAAPGARELRPGPRTALRGLVLAGAWTDTGWPATMEGAVRSGHAAARELHAVLAAPPSGAPARERQGELAGRGT